MAHVDADPSEDAEPFVEVDPTGRYGRYQDSLGVGSVKKVYRAFDQQEGKEVAWNQISLRRIINDRAMMKRLYSEVEFLSSLNNQHIIAFFHARTDSENRNLNFISELCASGNLRDYRKRYRHVSMKAVKNWSRQILRGLEYLHLYEPCIMHRDINCSNIFINGNAGDIKIGDLGLAIEAENGRAHSIIGTPEFMAPEIYDENYYEKVDIYSFGMCLFEMSTLEILYSECYGVAKIHNMMASRIRPEAMDRVKDPEVKEFIEKCLDSGRPSASELLKDPFFDELDDDNEAECVDSGSDSSELSI